MKAYLAWPVKFKCYEEEFHVTAKYLGEVENLECVNTDTRDFDIDRVTCEIAAEVERRVCDKLNSTGLDLGEVKIHYQRFNRISHVLELADGVDARPYIVNKLLNSMRPDDYPGPWRPHITIPRLLWAKLKAEGITLRQLEPTVGRLTLYINKQAVRSFE